MYSLKLSSCEPGVLVGVEGEVAQTTEVEPRGVGGGSCGRRGDGARRRGRYLDFDLAGDTVFVGKNLDLVQRGGALQAQCDVLRVRGAAWRAPPAALVAVQQELAGGVIRILRVWKKSVAASMVNGRGRRVVQLKRKRRIGPSSLRTSPEQDTMVKGTFISQGLKPIAKKNGIRSNKGGPRTSLGSRRHDRLRGHEAGDCTIHAT
jgi:hypothetical protein